MPERHPQATAGRPVLIAGAGIAGLTLALALSRRGLPACLMEKRSAFFESGAGIQLGPNAMKVLSRLGVAPRLEPLACRPDAIRVYQGATGRSLTSLPLGKWLSARHGAPYCVAHRADLQSALLDAVRAAPGIEIITGFDVLGWQQEGDRLTIASVDGRTVLGRSLVGADGIWSTVRRTLFPQHPLTYAGKMAARTLIPSPGPGSRFAGPSTSVWLSPDAHVVHYPVRANREMAVVAVVDEATTREDWGTAIEATSVLARLIGFSPQLLGFLGQATQWHVWSLYDPPPLPAWSQGHVGLIGDAAHPILPFFAQGGAMALEDAETLAALMAAAPAAPDRVFVRFEELRRARVLRVQDASRQNGRTFHLHGATAIARDLTLQFAPGTMMMRRYDWLYGWDGDGT